MSAELKIIDLPALDQTEQAELDAGIDSLIAAHKNNRQEINRLVFDSVAAMTVGEDYERQLANKKGLKRFLGGITGSNKKLQDKINSNRAMAQYAAQQTLQRLAEQNLMSFDLIAAVNNKLNASVIGIENEINEIYGALITFFKQSKSDIIKLESRVERLERNVNLLNWQNAIEYQMFNGVEYPELDNVSKIVCLTRDFYDITKGEWTTSDLLLLKTAMSTIEISPRDNINFYDFIQRITYDSALSDYLLGGKQIQSLPEPYLIPLLGMKKLELLDGEESYVVDTIMEQMEGNHIPAERRSIQSSLARRYLRQEAQVDVDAQVNHYDLIMEMLFNLQAAESTGIIKQEVEEIGAADLYERGLRYEQGDGVEKDLEQAIHFFQIAAEQGNPDAQYNLGRRYYFGDGIAEDGVKAVEWFRKAAEQGNCGAQRFLGDCYYDGYGIAQDDTKAVEWYRKAAERGSLVARYSLGDCYYFGKGVSQDYAKAVEWYRKAADQGGTDGQRRLGDCYYSGTGVPQNYEKAVEWYRKAAEQGNSDAQAILGECYYNGIGVHQDFEKAVEWYRKAAEQGIHDAQFGLGNCYYFGRGVPQDLEKAVVFYERAAELGHSVGQYNLAICYLNGDGIPYDREKARFWLKKSAEQGYQQAKDMLRDNF